MNEISTQLIEYLELGGVVAYPTSTLPGLGCLPIKNGLDSLFAMKNRSDEQPVSLGVFSLEQAEEIVDVSEFC